jgi:hypothetical protein
VSSVAVLPPVLVVWVSAAGSVSCCSHWTIWSIWPIASEKLITQMIDGEADVLRPKAESQPFERAG